MRYFQIMTALIVVPPAANFYYTCSFLLSFRLRICDVIVSAVLVLLYSCLQIIYFVYHPLDLICYHILSQDIHTVYILILSSICILHCHTSLFSLSFLTFFTSSLKQGRGTLKRVDEVFDCWFESGSMPYAQLHYPFENVDRFEKGFPADFIAEGLDQTRGWFYTLMVISTCLFNKPGKQECVCVYVFVCVCVYVLVLMFFLSLSIEIFIVTCVCT